MQYWFCFLTFRTDSFILLSMKEQSSLMWFRQDLRIKDNPALDHAAKQGDVLPIYILDDENAREWKMGGASRAWLHHALEDLNKSLDSSLQIFVGKADEIVPKLVKDFDIKNVYWTRCYEPWRMERDKKIKTTLNDNDINVESFNASLLWEPWTVRKDDGDPYKVFTPFYRKKCLAVEPPSRPSNKKREISFIKDKHGDRVTIKTLGLLPKTLEWHHEIEQEWDISEAGAHDRLATFLEEGLAHYKKGRDFPGTDYVSRLSPYLHFGQISPNQVWYAVKDFALENEAVKTDADHFCSELGWREFSYNLLYHFQDLPEKNLQDKFDRFPWANNDKHLKAWQKGQTGCPIVDAGMRQLWQTGYMHNRVRMIVGSFLVKNLRLHWHLGEKWFWDCLVDADLANNAASWQWIAGCGADAAPYFRIFNPVTQGQKFDPEGDYVRRFAPELKDMPDKYLHNPWDAPDDVLEKAGVILDKTYPRIIVDLKASREAALDAFQSLKKEEV